MENADQIGMAVNILNKRCKKALATILTLKERESDDFLPAEVKARLRKVILDQFNEFNMLAVDCVKSAVEIPPDSGPINDLYWEQKAALSEISEAAKLLVEIASRED